MANFVNTSLDMIRRHKPRHPRLHARWGDVGITPPVEGAWSQLENPYLRGDKKYGPGYVPGLDIGDKEVLILDPYSDYSEEEFHADMAEEEKRMSRSRSSSVKEGTKALSKARRLSRILLPSSVNTSITKSAEKEKVEKERATDFQYVPVKPNYAQELAENISSKSKPRFRYVPASKHYLRDLKVDNDEDDNHNDKEHRHYQNDTDADADDEGESRKSTSSSKRHHQKEPTRSQSCDPYIIGGKSVVAELTGRRKPRSRNEVNNDEIKRSASRNTSVSEALPSGSLTRKSSTWAGQREQDPSNSNSPSLDQSRGRFIRSGTRSPAAVQRSKSSVNKLHRRTMTLEMVGNQEDLWY